MQRKLDKIPKQERSG